jgi:hypothetical protein
MGAAVETVSKSRVRVANLATDQALNMAELRHFLFCRRFFVRIGLTRPIEVRGAKRGAGACERERQDQIAEQ